LIEDPTLTASSSFLRINIDKALYFLLNSGNLSPLKQMYFDELILPMISFEEIVDVSWLVGLNTTEDLGLDYAVMQAVQKNRLKMNEFGVRAQSAVGMAFMTCCIKPAVSLTVDSPFFMWLERPGLRKPLFVAWLDYDSWKDPGSLE
jgi:hypothetical protein